MKYLLVLVLLILSSCSKPFVDPAPLTLIPADFKFVGRINVPNILKTPGINNRLEYETKRKPTLKVLPLADLKTLYIASSSGKQTEEKGLLYVSQFMQKCELDKIIANYELKTKSDKQIIVTRSKLDNLLIYQIRDRKQELAICQIGPKTCLAGPLDQIVSSFKLGEENISKNQKLQQYLVSSEDSDLALFLLSAKDIGAYLQNFQFFDSVAVKLKNGTSKTELNINADCQNNEAAQKTAAALTLVQTVLMFSKGQHIKPGDIEVKHQESQAIAKAQFSNEAMIDLFSKKKK
ncbi:MAG: hypothetical protein MK132_22120 [Lentisphaerales bacterium]|nr:hypothetical protein [Lentisphaerales bacterium]